MSCLIVYPQYLADARHIVSAQYLSVECIRLGKDHRVLLPVVNYMLFYYLP